MKKNSCNNGELEYISLLRNISIILVLLGHAGCIYAGKWNINIINPNSVTLKYITEYIYSFHMPLYVAISGFLYRFTTQKTNKMLSLKELIKKKFNRLIIPYILTGILFVIPLQSIFGVYGNKASYFYRITEEILLAKRPTHLWYLLMLFSLFIVFRVFEHSINKHSFLLNIVLFFMLNIISYPLINRFPMFYITSSLKYILYFYIGYSICTYSKYTNFSYINSVIFMAIHASLFIIKFFILRKLNFNYIKVIEYALNIFISWSAILGLFNLTYSLCNNMFIKNSLLKSKLYIYIDRNNFYIYLFHHPIMLSAIMILKEYPIKPIYMYLIIFFVTFILSLITASLYRLLKNYLLRYRNVDYVNIDKRNFFLDNIKGILIILVVIGHACDLYTYKSLNARRLFLFIYSFHMPLFIFISGYFCKNTMDSGKKVFCKCKYFIILFLLLKLFFFITDIVIFKAQNPKFSFFYESGVPWYMFAMAVWIALTYILKKFKFKYVFFPSLLIGIFSGYIVNIGDFLCLSRIMVFYPFFILGWKTKLSDINKLFTNKKIKYFISASSFIILLFLIVFCNKFYGLRGFFSGRNSFSTLNMPLLGGLIRIGTYLISFIVGSSLLYFAPKNKCSLSNIGSNTLQIYFFHYVFLTFYQHIFHNTDIIIFLLYSVFLCFLLSNKFLKYPFDILSRCNKGTQ